MYYLEKKRIRCDTSCTVNVISDLDWGMDLLLGWIDGQMVEWSNPE